MDKSREVFKTVSAAEDEQVSRNLLIWLNTYESKPNGVDIISYEYLPATSPAMALSTIQATYITREYILGGYEAEYQFKIIYRINAGASNDKRLKADEALNALSDWLSCNKPPIDGVSVRKIEATTRAALFAAYANGEEDHQILMKMTYEVNV